MLLECKNLALGYGKNVLLENLNFTVDAGDYLCVVGENGSGKTTLMRTVLSLQPPLSGEIKFSLGKNQIGYLPQQSQAQRDFPASVYEVVVSGAQSQSGFRPFYSHKEKSLAARNMERMGISHLAKKSYRELSGGQQQRVLLARALCAAKKMLLLDEPVNGLDPKAAEEMYSLVEELNKRDGMCIIMISHDVDEALRFATHILHIGSGAFFGSRDEYVKSPFFRATCNACTPPS